MDWLDKLFNYGWIIVILAVLFSLSLWIFFIWVIIKLLQFIGVI